MALKILILWFFLVAPVRAKVDVSDDVMGARGVIDLVKNHSKFKIEKCPRVEVAKWIGFFLMRHPIHLRYNLSPGCDLEGSVLITAEPFPIQLKVRNLGEIFAVHAIGSSEVVTEPGSQNMSLKFIFNKGQLFKREGVLMNFEGNYSWSLSESKDHRGFVHVTSFKGHPLDFNESLDDTLFH